MNSFLINISAIDLGIDSKSLIGISKLQVSNKLSKSALLWVALFYAEILIGQIKNIPKLLRISDVCQDLLLLAIMLEEDSKAKNCNLSILEKFLNRLIKLLIKSF